MSADEDEEDVNDEFLYAVRTNDVDTMKEYLTKGASVNYAEPHGHSTPLHYASANGHIDVVTFLIEKGAVPKVNNGGNSPLHWACLNKHVDVVELLTSSFSETLDVLAKNEAGKSALTYAFKSGLTNMIKVVLSHPSAAELEQQQSSCKEGNDTSAKDEDAGEQEKGTDTPLAEASVTHEIVFKKRGGGKKKKKKATGSKESILKIRELPIVDKTVFNATFAKADEDKTGLALWPASIVLSRWIASISSAFKGKTVCELGAGCGLPGVTASVYGRAKHVVLTDYYDETVRNLRYNALENSTEDGTIVVKAVDWAKKWVDEPFDMVVGADLIYAKEAVPLLLRTIRSALKEGGHFLYVCPDERDGLVDFINSAEKEGLYLASCKEAPRAYYKNPLRKGSDKECDMFFPGLLSSKPVLRLYDYVRVVADEGS